MKPQAPPGIRFDPFRDDKLDRFQINFDTAAAAAADGMDLALRASTPGSARVRTDPGTSDCAVKPVL